MHASRFLTYLIYFTTNNGQKIAHSWLLPHFTKTLKRRSRPAPPLPHRARAQPGTVPAAPPSRAAPGAAAGGAGAAHGALRHRPPWYRSPELAARPGPAPLSAAPPWLACPLAGVPGPPFCGPHGSARPGSHNNG